MKLTSKQKELIKQKQEFYSNKSNVPYVPTQEVKDLHEVFTKEVVNKIVKHRWDSSAQEVKTSQPKEIKG